MAFKNKIRTLFVA